MFTLKIDGRTVRTSTLYTSLGAPNIDRFATQPTRITDIDTGQGVCGSALSELMAWSILDILFGPSISQGVFVVQ